ncbi:Bgr_08870 family protein [Bartonella queenslandensis]|uniref:Bgr_08870 family protein n=1 Tax=Bartonella queenslandensis TaxID=481138 RepID=UPI0003072A7A|nr:Bgr_08870 family protein [Bartonella queenslandensis]
MTKTKKLDMELPKEGRFISSEFPILRENLNKLDQALVAVEEKIDEKAPLQHTHSIGDVRDLESALNGKMAADKTFSFADLSDIEGAKDAANNYVLYKSSNNNFTFGSAVSLLGAHQHKTEDIVGLDDFRAKINQDLTSYGRLANPNEWKNYNKFTSKVTMSGGLELLGNSSFSLIHNGEVVTSLNTTGSTLKGPLKVDGDLVYTKEQVDALIKKRKEEYIEITMLQNGNIPWPDGVTDDTEIEIMAWGAGGSGGQRGGGGGGECVTLKIQKRQLQNNDVITIGKGGYGNGANGGNTLVGSVLTARGGKGNNGYIGGNSGGGVSGGCGHTSNNESGFSGKSHAWHGGSGGGGAVNNGRGGNGGDSSYGGAGGGGSGGDGNVPNNGGKGGKSQYGGNGGNGGELGNGGGGGGGYRDGEDGTRNSFGRGGDGAVKLKVFV